MDMRGKIFGAERPDTLLSIKKSHHNQARSDKAEKGPSLDNMSLFSHSTGRLKLSMVCKDLLKRFSYLRNHILRYDAPAFFRERMTTRSTGYHAPADGS